MGTTIFGLIANVAQAASSTSIINVPCHVKRNQNHFLFIKINTPVTDRVSEIPRVIRKACGEP